ncbi:MAG: hypothetical protein DRN29_11125, partial [Thermoplasmata archaeon]
MKLRKIVVIVAALILLPAVYETKFIHEANINYKCIERQDAMAVIASKENPFYALIATPVALYYDEYNQMHVKPLLIENISNPSDSILRFKELYGLKDNEAILIADKNATEASIEIAEQIWESSEEAIIIKEDFEGYSIGVNLVALASYKGIPVFVANSIDEILPTLQSLGVKTTYVCGNIEGYGNVVKFKSIEEARNYMMKFVKEKFGGVGYVVMTNPMDIEKPKVLDSVEYHFEGTINSGSTLHGLNILLSGFNYSVVHAFEVPYDGFVRIKIELINKDSDDVEKWGDRLFLHLATPDNVTFIYTSTAGGIPVVDENGNIIVDRLDYQTCVYNKPGIYKAEIVGTWIAKRKGSYEMNVKVEKIDKGNFPLMKDLSSLAAYLAAYHRGIIWASPEFAFAGGENVDVEGIIYPISNEFLVEPCNEHFMAINQQLNELLA